MNTPTAISTNPGLATQHRAPARCRRASSRCTRAGAAGLAHRAVAVAVHRPAHGPHDPATVERGAGQQIEHASTVLRSRATPAGRRTRSCCESAPSAHARRRCWRRRSPRWSAGRRRRSSLPPSGSTVHVTRRATPPSAQSWIDSVPTPNRRASRAWANSWPQDRDQEGDRCRRRRRRSERRGALPPMTTATRPALQWSADRDPGEPAERYRTVDDVCPSVDGELGARSIECDASGAWQRVPLRGMRIPPFGWSVRMARVRSRWRARRWRSCGRWRPRRRRRGTSPRR